MKLLIDLGLHVSPTSCIAETVTGGCCAYLLTKRFGTAWACGLFNGQSVMGDAMGPLQRLPECIVAARDPVEMEA